MAKEDLLREAEALGIEGLDESFTNKQIKAQIEKAQDASESAPDPSDEPETAVEGDDTAEEVEGATVAPEPVFEIRQFRVYSEQVFGVGYHVLVGAQSAGCFPAGKVTKDQIRAGIDQYLNMPVEQGKEG